VLNKIPLSIVAFSWRSFASLADSLAKNNLEKFEQLARKKPINFVLLFIGFRQKEFGKIIKSSA
jgi:hypothetical protein